MLLCLKFSSTAVRINKPCDRERWNGLWFGNWFTELAVLKLFPGSLVRTGYIIQLSLISRRLCDGKLDFVQILMFLGVVERS